MRHSIEQQIPAIVVGRGFTALGALRSLHMAGIPVCVACPAGDIAARSRWYRPAPGSRAWQGELGAAGEEILDAMPIREAVLVPAADDAALWVADLPAGLRDRFRVSSSPLQALEILQDKARFGAWLADRDIPHPRTYPVETERDIDTIPFGEIEKVFIKPVDSQQFSQSLGIKALWARNRAEFESTWRNLEQRGLRVMAQEYVSGGYDDHYFIDGFRDGGGKYPGCFARRRRRIYPPDFGNSSYSESIPLDELADAWLSLSRMLDALRYRGIFSAEFKRDARDGLFKILEVNTRAWWYVEFAARCGVNVCEMAYHDALGQPVPAPRVGYRIGAGSVNFAGDLKTVWTSRRQQGHSLWQVLGQWLRAHYLVFRMDDPRPGLVAMRKVVGGFVKNRIVARLQSRPPGDNAACNGAGRTGAT